MNLEIIAAITLQFTAQILLSTFAASLNFNGCFFFLFQLTPAFWEEEEVSDHLLFLTPPPLPPELSKQLELQLWRPHIGTSVFLRGVLLVYGRV